MTAEKIRRIHTVYGWVNAALCFACGVALILACLAIYAGGEGVFSRESVWAAFLSVLVPVLLCLFSPLGGLGLSLFLPMPCAKRIGGFSEGENLNLDRARLRYENLLLRTDTEKMSPEMRTALKKEEKKRTALRIFAAAFSAACALPPLVYLLNPAHFPNENLNAEILAALCVLLPCTLLALAACYAVGRINSASLLQSADLLRDALAEGAKRENAPSASEMTEEDRTAGGVSCLRAWFSLHEKTLILALRSAVGALAVAFIVLGVGNGGMNSVLEKAVRICTECIGLG